MLRFIACLGFVFLGASCASVADQCTTRVFRACTASDGTPGMQVCRLHRWDDCRPSSSMHLGDGGLLSDAAMSDSGTSGTDAGSSSGIDSGSGSSATSESLERIACETGRGTVQPYSLTASYDIACVNRLFSPCPTGWEIVGWDENACREPSDPGISTVTLTYVHRYGGSYGFSLRCPGRNFDGWPATSRNQPVNTACISSVHFDDGVELADNEARFCGNAQVIITIPAQPGAIANCP